MAHDHSPDWCECCERTQDAWDEINEIAEALDFVPDYCRHVSADAIIEEIEELQDLIRRQRVVLAKLGRLGGER